MGLDCYFMAVPKSKDNSDFDSPFFGDFESPTEPRRYLVFMYDIGYFRKNWFIYDFFNKVASRIAGDSFDTNSTYIRYGIDDMKVLLSKIKCISENDYDAHNGFVRDINSDTRTLREIYRFMKDNSRLFDFYFMGNY